MYIFSLQYLKVLMGWDPQKLAWNRKSPKMAVRPTLSSVVTPNWREMFNTNKYPVAVLNTQKRENQQYSEICQVFLPSSACETTAFEHRGTPDPSFSSKWSLNCVSFNTNLHTQKQENQQYSLRCFLHLCLKPHRFQHPGTPDPSFSSNWSPHYLITMIGDTDRA